MSNNALSLRDIKPETAIAIRGNTTDYMVSPRDIIEWVAPTAPIGEAKKFLLVCQTAGLNPLLGDIDLLQLGGKWQAVVRKNGYLKCARRDPDFDGLESGITIQPFKRGIGGNSKTGPPQDIQGGIYDNTTHLLIGGWCKLYKKNISRPFFKRVSFAEYNKGGDVNGPWRKLPATMIEKVAIAHACREAVDLLAATYDESELLLPPRVETRVMTEVHQAWKDASGAMIEKKAVQVAAEIPDNEMRRAMAEVTAKEIGDILAPFSAPEIVEVEAEQAQPATPEQIDRIKALMVRIGMSPQGMSESLDRRGVTRFEDLDQVQVADMISKLEIKASAVEFDPFPLAIVDPEAETPAQPAPEAVETEVVDADAS